MESGVDGADLAQQKEKKTKRKGCWINCWKFTTHTKVVPQEKLYNYLAEKSSVVDSHIFEDYSGEVTF